jgi:hypothetical protein
MIAAPNTLHSMERTNWPKTGSAIPMTDTHNQPKEASNEAIAQLVERLNALKEGEHILAALVECGQQAVEPLRWFLFDGTPSSVYQPRQRAVEALAALGAQDILIEYLTRDKDIPDPIDRYGEEAVEGTAARLIGRWRHNAVYDVLLQLLRKKPLPGLIDAIGEFQRTEPIPELIRCLGDSICCTFAENALRKLGQSAYRQLLAAARTPEPSAEYESPSSLCRRRSTLRLLAELGVSEEDWPHLAPLRGDHDPEVVIRTNKIALAVSQENENIRAVGQMIGMLAHAPWFLRIEIESWLLDRFELTMEVIAQEITVRRSATNLDDSMDETLRWLHTLKERLTRYHDQRF